VRERGVPFPGALTSVLEQEGSVPLGHSSPEPNWDQYSSENDKQGGHKDFKLANWGEGKSKTLGSITGNGKQSNRLAREEEVSTTSKIRKMLKGRRTQEMLLMEVLGFKKKLQN